MERLERQNLEADASADSNSMGEPDKIPSKEPIEVAGDLGMDRNGDIFSSSTREKYMTAPTHQKLYPLLDEAESSPPTSRDSSYVVQLGDGRGVVVKRGVIIGGVSDESHSDDFTTAQQNSSQLLQLLTAESTSDHSDLSESKSSLGQSEKSVVGSHFLDPQRGSDARKCSDVERPKSVPIGGYTSRSLSRKSPLATSASRAPHLLSRDHASEATPTKPREEEEREIKPSAPPRNIFGTDKRGNSYAGLGKRRMNLARNLPSSKKSAIVEIPPLIQWSGAKGAGGSGRHHQIEEQLQSSLPPLNPQTNPPPPPARSLPQSALGLAAMMLKQATGQNRDSGARLGGVKEEATPSPAGSKSPSWLKRMKARLQS